MIISMMIYIKQRKYENQKKISEIQIENEIYSGNDDVVRAIENKMRTELRSFDELDLCQPSTMDERVFLEKNAGYKIVRSREGFFNWTNN